jgi:Glycosyltransferases, probably involved in cell wall biogenesis
MWLCIFWISVLIIFYTYFGYPLIIAVASRIWPIEVKKTYVSPAASVVITAHNEESTIRARLENVLSLSGSENLSEIVVISDGSDDKTVDQAKSVTTHNRVIVIDNKRREGKASSINQAVSLCSGEIIVFADSRQRFESDVLKELLANFCDERIGAVSGECFFNDGEKTNIGEGMVFYWNYEKFLRKVESRFDSTCGASGAIYAIRRKLFTPVPKDTLLDDVVIPMNIVMQGYRCIFEPKARAFDSVATTSEQEARRKIRTIAGNFQMFFRYPFWLNPVKNRIWFQIFSHKYLRLMVPIFNNGAYIKLFAFRDSRF